MTDIPVLDKQGLRRFGLMFGGIIAGLFGLLFPFVFGFNFPLWPWIVLLLFVCWSLIAPQSIDFFYKLWMRFGLILNAIMSRIILGIVFYIVVFPIGIIFKLKGSDPMNRKRDKKLESYRVLSEEKEMSRMEKPF